LKNILAAMGAVAVAFAVVLGFGFWVHERDVVISDSTFGLLAGLAIAGAALGIYGWVTGIRFWPLKQSARVRPMPAVPYVPRVLTEAERAYPLNPTMTVSCTHLAPIEKAMRLAGIEVQYQAENIYRPIVQARCRVNVAELKRVFALTDNIFYKEGYEPERYEIENPRADLFCLECLKADRARSTIRVLHPDECTPDTVWFPASSLSPDATN
jgi:hypothetical protein